MSENLIQLFVELISNYTGLRIRPQDREALSRKLWSRIHSLKISSPEDYYQLLKSGMNADNTLRTIAANREWKELIALLTTGESYFFRDRGQFWLLEHVILPEAIAYQRQLCYNIGSERPALRLWSAGCSTGEEPYSLAILLTQLIPDWENWNLSILGTDINQESIDKAKQGSYTTWSFRMVEPERLPEYFHQSRNQWKINEKFRNLVTFRQGNLARDRFPDLFGEIYNMDLIICRNVFVYFESQVIAEILEKFYHTLRPGGYLMTAHAELHGQNLRQFIPKVFPQSVVYQRSDRSQRNGSASASQSSLGQPLSVSPIWTQPKVSPTVAPKATSAPTGDRLYSPRSISTDNPERETLTNALFNQANFLFKRDRLEESLQKAEQVIRSNPRHLEAYCLIAEIYANLGQMAQAEHHCKQAISIDSLAVKPYYLMAHIAEDRQDLERAKSWLKRIIYLAPLSIGAYLELAAIYEKEKNFPRAKKMRKIAWEMLDDLPEDYSVERPENITAGELKQYIKKMLDRE